MFSTQEILEATNGKIIQGRKDLKIKGISIDSRTIRPGELFIAIKGKVFDGHNFIKESIRKSSIGAIVSRIEENRYPKNYNLIYVKDTLKALADIAKLHHKKFHIPIIAITGSCGKTTTKEMVGAILKTKYNILKTPGTENNQFGISLSLLGLNKRHRIAVLELGTNHFGEIKYLTEISQPNIGIMLNIGPAHLEFLKNLPSVFREKFNLARYIIDIHGKIIFNNDDKFFKRINLKKGDFKIYTFGKTQKSDFWTNSIKTEKNSLQFLLNNRFWVKLRTPAEHNVYNALAAIACGRIFNISFKTIIDALSRFKFPLMRMKIEKIKKVYIIDDTYNSNPLSLENALKTISSYNSGGRKILVCADMLELGKNSEQIHFFLGKKISRYKIDILITVGRLSRFFSKGAKSIINTKIKTWDFNCNKKAADKLLNIIRPHDIILVKGSRSMRLETVTNALRAFLRKRRK